MQWQAAWTLLVVLVMTLALVRDWVAPAVGVLGANLVLLLSGVIDTGAALAGFSSPAPITVAALFVVAGAVRRTGALQPLVLAIVGDGDAGLRGMLRLLLPITAVSAFLNNTAIVAMLAPPVAEWAGKTGQSAARYLMPISFATILGGVITVMGTSTNLVVSGLLEEAGLAPLGFFELAKVGLPVAIVGVLVVAALAPVVLPDRRQARRHFAENPREYVVHQTVVEGGALEGQTVERGGLRQLQGVFLVEIERGGRTIAPATPTTVLRGGDRLAFVGRVDLVRDLHGIRGLVSAEQKHAIRLEGGVHTFFEVVVSPAGAMVGRTLKEMEFRGRYQAAVVAIHRAGERVRAKLGEVRLQGGDTLLVVADPGFAERWRDCGDFLLVGHLGGSPPASTRKAYLVGAMTLAIVLLAGSEVVPILEASLLGALVLVLGRALTSAEARSSLELDTLLVIAASFGVGAAVERSGLASLIGGGLVAGFRDFGPAGVLLAVTLATLLLTELITNNAAAVLMFPVALASELQIGADPRPFVVALTVAASASFLTPIGYQTNLMVYGPGGYRFGDYARLGAPLTGIVVLLVLVVVPLFWPF